MNRRALVIVSLAAVTILGAIALALALMSNDGASPGVVEPTPESGPGSDGVRFDDPQGTYRIDIDPDWHAVTPVPASRVESWMVDGAAGAQERIDIDTDTIGDLDLDEYLQLEIERAPEAIDDFKLREFRVVTIDPPDAKHVPTQLGVVAYEGTRAAAPVAYLLVSSVQAGRAVVAKLATTPDDFDDARAQVEPYLMTLRPT